MFKTEEKNIFCPDLNQEINIVLLYKEEELQHGIRRSLMGIACPTQEQMALQGKKCSERCKRSLQLR